MKTRVILLTPVLALTLTLNSQVPQGINYQAIARNSSGVILDNKTLVVELTIQSSTGIPVWRENKSLTSNQFGLITTVLGTGPNQLGSPSTFSGINWNAQPLFLKTRVQYPETIWNDMGTTQIWSVPYALVAKDVEGPLTKLNISGTSTLPEESLFEVKNKNGEIVFAVYNEGVRVYVPDGAKGAKGGFAVSGFSSNKTLPENYLFVSPDSIRAYIWDDPIVKVAKGGFMVSGFNSSKSITNNFLEINPDSVRIYIDKAPSTKGAKGGFAVSGFGSAKGENEEYLRVTRDSTRIYINDLPAKGAKGGFTVAGFNQNKGLVQDFLKVSKDSTNIKTSGAGGFTVANYETGAQGNYLDLTPENYFIGHQAGSKITYGRYNFFMGYKAGLNTTGVWPVGRAEGSYNSFIGYQAGYSNTIGKYNLFLGYKAGYSNLGSLYWDGNYNSFLGYQSGYSNITGYGNAFMGYNTGYTNTTGSFTVAIGYESGYSNNASNNVFVGSATGKANTTGTGNAFLGAQAGWSNTEGDYNVFLGSVAGVNNTTGDQNIYIGDHAGYTPAAGSRNIFLGYLSGMNFSSGGSNIFIGDFSGIDYDQGNYNIFIGSSAGDGGATGDASGRENIAIGWGAAGALTSGQKNIMLGSGAGSATTTGIENLFLGNRAGYFETGSAQFYIDVKQRTDLNDQRSKALMYGNFDNLPSNQYLRLNARVGINGAGSTSYSLYVTGNAYTTGTWGSSDIRYKQSIIPIGNILGNVASLNPVYFNWRSGEFPEMNFDSDTQIGLIAQEVEKVFPELVRTDSEGYKAVSYEKLSVLLLSGMKEQQSMIESVQTENEILKEELEKMKLAIEELRKVLLNK